LAAFVKLVTEFTPEFSWRKPLLIGPVPRGCGGAGRRPISKKRGRFAGLAAAANRFFLNQVANVNRFIPSRRANARCVMLTDLDKKPVAFFVGG
jgi:hypothetical protein